MMYLFNAKLSNIKTNEDFRKVVQKKIKIMGILILSGGLTILASFCATMAGLLDSDSYLFGLYTGIGSGLIGAGVIKILQLRNVLRREELLKAERLKYTDERNQAISARAIQSATFFVLIFSYIIMLVGVFYSRVIFFCYWSVVIGFGLSYMFMLKYYKGKM